MGSDASPFWVLMSKKTKILDLIFFKIKTKLAFFAFLHYYEQKRGVWGGGAIRVNMLVYYLTSSLGLIVN